MEKFSLGQLMVTKGIQSKINSDVDFLIIVLEILERYRRRQNLCCLHLW